MTIMNISLKFVCMMEYQLLVSFISITLHFLQNNKVLPLPILKGFAVNTSKVAQGMKFFFQQFSPFFPMLYWKPTPYGLLKVCISPLSDDKF